MSQIPPVRNVVVDDQALTPAEAVADAGAWPACSPDGGEGSELVTGADGQPLGGDGQDVSWCDLAEDALLPLAAQPVAVVGIPILHSCLPPPPAADLQRAERQLERAWQALDPAAQAAAADASPMPEGTFTQQMHAAARNPADFQPGLLRACGSLWRHYFELQNGGRPMSSNQRQLLAMITDGVRFRWVGAPGPDVPLPPLRRKKRRIVLQMLAQALGRDKDPEAYLTGLTPHAVQFPNHRSTSAHMDFVTAEVRKCLQTGVVREWPAKWGRPTVINGLRVVDGKKLRLCMNPMYPNLFMEIPPLKYESLADLPGFLHKGDFMFTTDDKSGYWNLLLHPDMYRFAAFEWQGNWYYWLAMAFGFAPACWVYSLLKQELFRPLRQRGVNLAFLIDDCAVAARNMAAAQHLCGAVVDLLTALGFTLSLEKCQLYPAPRVRFLGLIVDTEREAFEVPEDKVRQLEDTVANLEAAGPGAITAREVARLAGRIMALSLAVATAPLHARVVGRALAGAVDWDEAVGDPATFLARARLFVELLRRKNGKTWWRRGPAVVLQVVGDASEKAYAALLPGQELGPGEASQMVVYFTPEEQARMRNGEMSSTERELRTVALAVEWLQERGPQLLAGRQLQYHTDSQAAAFCVLGMKGKGMCLQRVDELYQLCAGSDLEVQPVWHPRSEKWQQLADGLSKFEDGSQWCLDGKVYRRLWEEDCLRGRGPPLVDVFADEFSTKLPGRFFSRFWSPGALAVDAFAQDWGEWGRDGLLYINPPFDQMGRVVRKVADDRPDCVLITPVWPRWWRVTLDGLPIKARKRLLSPTLFWPGPQVPGMEARGPKVPRYAVEAVYILW